jgi:hypothetical protein
LCGCTGPSGLRSTRYAHREGIQLTAEEQVEIFGTTACSEEYAAAVQQYWGDTDAWKQSQQRVSKLSKQDWIAIKTEERFTHYYDDVEPWTAQFLPDIVVAKLR